MERVKCDMLWFLNRSRLHAPVVDAAPSAAHNLTKHSPWSGVRTVKAGKYFRREGVRQAPCPACDHDVRRPPGHRADRTDAQPQRQHDSACVKSVNFNVGPLRAAFALGGLADHAEVRDRPVAWQAEALGNVSCLFILDLLLLFIARCLHLLLCYLAFVCRRSNSTQELIRRRRGKLYYRSSTVESTNRTA